MPVYDDIFHRLQVGAPLFAGEQVTADGMVGNVLDLRDKQPGDLVGFILLTDAVATADADNHLQVQLYEADEKDDATTLTGGGTQVADADVIGFTVDGERSRVVNPDHDLTAPEGTRVGLPFLQDGFLPLINDTDLAGKAFWFSYRGYKNCLQFRVEETGAADATLTCVPVFAAANRTYNLVAGE
jgi:hypothetical protein